MLAVVALLLLPDARSIAVGGLTFERLSADMHHQKEDVDKLSAEVSTISHSLIAGSQVNLALGTTVPGTTLDAGGTDVSVSTAASGPRQDDVAEQLPAPTAAARAAGGLLTGPPRRTSIASHNVTSCSFPSSSAPLVGLAVREHQPAEDRRRRP